MGRISWSTVPSMQVSVTLADPPQTDNVAANDWMQQAKRAIDTLSQPNVELQEFLNDLLQSVKEIDRDAINALSSISETAGATYTANEQTMMANLKTAVNGLLANL